MNVFRDPLATSVSTSMAQREGLYPTGGLLGIWTSADIDTNATGSGIFGLLAHYAALAPGTSIMYRVVSAPDRPVSSPRRRRTRRHAGDVL